MPVRQNNKRAVQNVCDEEATRENLLRDEAFDRKEKESGQSIRTESEKSKKIEDRKMKGDVIM